MRKPLDAPIESRDGNKTLTKDSKLTNFMKDPLAPEKILKRPGMWQTNAFSPAGQGFGVYSFYDITTGTDIIYSWSNLTDSLIPETGVIDESLMARGILLYLDNGDGTYTIILSPNNPYSVGGTFSITNNVVIPGTTYEILSITTNSNGYDEITFSLPSTIIFGYSTTAGGETHACYWDDSYVIHDLGTLGGTISKALGRSGQIIVGSSQTSGGLFHACYWDSGLNIHDLGTLGGTTSQANGMYGSTIVGYAYTSGGLSHACYWDNSFNIYDLGTLGGTSSIAWGMVGSVIVGTSFTSGGVQHACYWDSGLNIHDLGVLPSGTTSQALATDGSIIVGWSDKTGFSQCAFYYDTSMHALSTLGGFRSVAYGVDNNVIVGYAHTGAPTKQYACYWDSGRTIYSLGTLGGDSSIAYGIKGSIIVGMAYTSTPNEHAFYWDGSMHDLGTLGGTSSYALGIK